MERLPLCACGCGERVKTPGSTWKAGHKNGRLNKTGFLYVEGLHYVIDPETGCWNWIRFLWLGYAAGGTGGFAHRRGYESVHGKIAGGYECHHACHNRRCINPAHMEIVEKREHLRRHKQADSHLTAQDVADMRWAHYEGATLDDLAELYETTFSNVGYICRGGSWPNAGGPIEPPLIECEVCGDEFPRKHPASLYCSRTCKQRARRARLRLAA